MEAVAYTDIRAESHTHFCGTAANIYHRRYNAWGTGGTDITVVSLFFPERMRTGIPVAAVTSSEIPLHSLRPS